MLASINPATGETIKSYPEHTAKEISALVEGADKAFQKWRDMSFAERGAKFKAAAGILLKNKDAYARLMAEEMGKPFGQGASEIEKCAWVCEFYADEAEKFLKDEPVHTDAEKSYVRFEPLGVVFAIMPWNFPFWQVFRFAAPTLMAGNAALLKHAPNVTGSALEIGKIFKEAGFPEGLFGVLLVGQEDLDQTTTNLIKNPLVKAVTLTGSVRAGSSVAAKAGAALKKMVLELGGSDPYLVLEDADLDLAAEICVASRLVNSGQSCVAGKRFIVVEKVLLKFTEKFLTRMKAQIMGFPLGAKTTVGPLARKDLRDALAAQVDASVKKGAKVLLGGVVPDDLEGAFYPPTVLADVKKGMPAYDEELFGPVAAIISVKDEAEAIRVANDSLFGLGSGIFTKNHARGEKIASQIDAGMCFVNAFVKSDPRLPFGGIKKSGYGRELSSFGIREFVNVKTVYISNSGGSAQSTE